METYCSSTFSKESTQLKFCRVNHWLIKNPRFSCSLDNWSRRHNWNFTLKRPGVLHKNSWRINSLVAFYQDQIPRQYEFVCEAVRLFVWIQTWEKWHFNLKETVFLSINFIGRGSSRLFYVDWFYSIKNSFSVWWQMSTEVFVSIYNLSILSFVEVSNDSQYL